MLKQEVDFISEIFPPPTEVPSSVTVTAALPQNGTSSTDVLHLPAAENDANVLPMTPTAEASSSLQAVEEVDISDRDRRTLAAANPERNMGKRKNLATRKEVQDIIAGMDPASFGHPCMTVPVPPEVLKLNEEYKDLFPSQLPPGLPPPLPTDNRILTSLRSSASQNRGYIASRMLRTQSYRSN